MSLGVYVPGDPNFLSLTPDSEYYRQGETVTVNIVSNHEDIVGIKVRVYPFDLDIPPVQDLPKPIYAKSKHLKKDGTGKLEFKGKKLVSGRYKLIGNTPKEAWRGEVSGLLFYSEFEIT